MGPGKKKVGIRGLARGVDSQASMDEVGLEEKRKVFCFVREGGGHTRHKHQKALKRGANRHFLKHNPPPPCDGDHFCTNKK